MGPVSSYLAGPPPLYPFGRLLKGSYTRRCDRRLCETCLMPDEPREEPPPPAPSPHADFIAGLPKAEIHVHHVGSASPRTVAELAARHPGKVPADLEGLRELYTFRDFAHFVEVYLAVVDLLR